MKRRRAREGGQAARGLATHDTVAYLAIPGLLQWLDRVHVR
ncbi:hypothetical protein [Microbacterium sp. RU33B]|nr:hypothetical protein [Microbacterium sp. RU33B]